MASSLGKLLVEIAADTASFKSDMGRAARVMEKESARIDKAGKRIDKTFATLKKTIAGFAVGLVGGVGVRGISRIFQDVAANAQSLQQVTKNLNVSVEGFQKLQIAADFAGVSTQQLDKGLQRMVRRLSEAASGTGEAQNALKELGVDVERLERLDAAETFTILTDELLKSETAADALRIAFKLFDSEFAQGALNVAAAAKDVGDQFDAMILTEEQNDRLAEMQAIFDSIKVSIKQATAKAVLFIVQLKDLAAIGGGADLAKLAATLFGGNVFQAAQVGAKLYSENLSVVNIALEQQAKKIEDVKQKLEDINPNAEFSESITRRLETDLKNLEATYDALIIKRRKLETEAPPKLADISISGGLGVAGGTSGGLGSAPSAVAQAAAALSAPLESFESDIDAATQSMLLGLVPAMDDTTAKTYEMQRTAVSAGHAFIGAFNPATFAADSLADSLENVALRLADILFQFAVADPFARSLGDLFSPSAGPVSSPQALLRGLNMQPRDGGGPGSAGSAYLIGRGAQPELFIPGTSGTFVPNADKLGGSANITFNVNAMDSQSVLGAIAQHERQIVGMVRKGYARRGNRVDL